MCKQKIIHFLSFTKNEKTSKKCQRLGFHCCYLIYNWRAFPLKIPRISSTHTQHTKMCIFIVCDILIGFHIPQLPFELFNRINFDWNENVSSRFAFSSKIQFELDYKNEQRPVPRLKINFKKQQQNFNQATSPASRRCFDEIFSFSLHCCS